MDLSLRPRSLQYDGSQRSLLNDSPCTRGHTHKHVSQMALLQEKYETQSKFKTVAC